MWRDPSRTNQNYQIKYVVSNGWGDPVQINRRPNSKMSFSSYEKEQLRESIGILTIAFTLALSDGLSVVMNNPNILITTLPLAFAAVMTGFLLHELAHKWMAQQYGCWAEYRGNKNGLYFALMMSVFGFLLAAPGAANKKPNTDIINAKYNPFLFPLYSAQHPYCCAIHLWAIS